MQSHEMNKPDTRRRLDDMQQGILGKPLDRVDGPVKVSGEATYANDWSIENLAHGVLVCAPFAKGIITSLDKQATMDMDGVLAVIDDQRLLRNPAQGTANKAPVQGCKQVEYLGQPIALVVANTVEQARHAALNIVIEFEIEQGVFDPQAVNHTELTDGKQLEQGDLDRAMKEAAYTVNQTYHTAGHSSAAMEPHAAIAEWDGDQLLLRNSVQLVKFNKNEIADSLGIDPEFVRILTPYVGGGFGAKLGLSHEAVASAIAAKELGCPVSVTLTRRQVFTSTIRRSESRQTIKLAADKNAKLIGLGHQYLVSNLPRERFSEPVGQATYYTYPGQHRRIVHELARVNRTCAGSVRAPGEAIGATMFEVAMDELAVVTGIDPVELRLINIPDKHPVEGIAYSSQKVKEVLTRGAEDFGWNKRASEVGKNLQGEWLIGMGVASAVRVNSLGESEAQVTLNADGTVVIESDMTDIGTGTYTILAQIAGEMLGLPLDKVDTQLGDSDMPPSAGSAASWGAASSGSSVFLACEDIRKKICQRIGVDETEATFKDGHVSYKNETHQLIDLLDGSAITAKGKILPGATKRDMHQASYGAHFAEVAVSIVTGETRVRRMLGVFSAGRILNQKTARSQCIGGMVWGIGMALTEELVHDQRDGHIVNQDLAEYHIPVNLDAPQIDVVFLDERDDAANPMQAKGVGELGIIGSGAAIINAIYNATGVRVRDMPATLDKILAGLPE